MKKAKDVMTRNPDFVRATATLVDAASKMRKLDVGGLPVCDEAGGFVGMITDRDITIRAVADGKDPTRTTVADAMTRELHCCEEDADVTEVARVMQERQVRRVPIVKGKREGTAPTELAGIVSLGDLAVDLRADEVPAKTLAEVSEESRAGSAGR